MFKTLRNHVTDISNTASREFYFMRENSGDHQNTRLSSAAFPLDIAAKPGRAKSDCLRYKLIAEL